MISFYGRDFGQRVARKHLGWYMDDAQTPKALRTEILTQSDPDVVLSQIPSALTERCAA
jgi:tRNA-dihydrouridine synthase